MSYDYRYTTSRKTTSGNRPGRRNYLPPPPPTRGNASNHSVLGYWVPLLVTGTIAIGGLAAWVWSERSSHDDDDYMPQKPPRPPPGPGGPYPTQGSQPYPGSPAPGQAGPSNYAQQQGTAPPPPPGGEASSYYNQTTTTSESRDVNMQQSQQDATWYGRVSGAIKRTPSPQQFFDSATRQVTAGMAAAGAALGSIMEGSDEENDSRRVRRTQRSSGRDGKAEDGFSDHERWSEEADERQRATASAVEAESERRADSARTARDAKGRRSAKKAVAIVVSAELNSDIGYNTTTTAEFTTEHASILSHLPTQHNSDTTDLFVLIYAPDLKALPPVNYQPNANITSTVGSSYSQISTPAVTPGSELQSMSPRIDTADSPSKQFDALYGQALALVSSPTQILPFTTREGYIHILKHLAPQLVYVSDALSGDEGESIAQLKGWVGHTILVAGDEGTGGLVDTETEDEGPEPKVRRERWYEDSPFVGLGKDVEVVDAVRVGEDWSRRVGGRQ